MEDFLRCPTDLLGAKDEHLINEVGLDKYMALNTDDLTTLSLKPQWARVNATFIRHAIKESFTA